MKQFSWEIYMSCGMTRNTLSKTILNVNYPHTKTQTKAFTTACEHTHIIYCKLNSVQSSVMRKITKVIKKLQYGAK